MCGLAGCSGKTCTIPAPAGPYRNYPMPGIPAGSRNSIMPGYTDENTQHEGKDTELLTLTPGQIAVLSQAKALNLIREAVNQIAGIAANISRPVDEYSIAGGYVGDSVTSIETLPQFEIAEKITAVVITGPAPSQSSIVGEGSATSPGAFASLATSGILPAGVYNVQWEVALAGTVSALDANNFWLSTPAITSINPAAIGAYPQEPVTVKLSAPGAIVLQSFNAGTTGAVYSGLITVTPANETPFTLMLGDRNFTLALPATGLLTMVNVGFLLQRHDRRLLSSAFAGNWTLELMGYADEIFG